MPSCNMTGDPEVAKGIIGSMGSIQRYHVVSYGLEWRTV